MTLARAVNTARHLRPAQLVARARLLARRRWRTLRAGLHEARLRAPPHPGRVPDPPAGVLPPPEDVARALDGPGRGTVELTLRGESRTFDLPLDWGPPGLTRLRLFHLHYMDWVRSLPTGTGLAVIEDWIERHPPYRPGYWRIAWASYCVSTRVVAWMQWVAERQVDVGAAGRIERSLVEQLRFLEDHLELDVSGNHVLRNARALLWGGAFFRGSDATRWRRRGERLLAREIERQILPDGMHYERAPYYHAEVFADLLECHAVLEPGGLRRRLASTLDAMASALEWLTGEGGRLPLFKDGGERGPVDPPELLALWADVSGSGDRPARRSLEHAGYYGVRGRDLDLVLFAGPLGATDQPGHAHADIFSFELAVGGALFCVDTGTATYEAGALRDLCRSTRAHNTVAIDGRDQAELWSSFRMARRFPPRVERAEVAGGRFEFRGRFDGWSRLLGDRLAHRRDLTWSPSEATMTLVDTVTGSGPHVVEASLHLHPAVSVARASDRRVTLARDGVAVDLRASHPVSVEESRYFPYIGMERPNQVLRVAVGEVPCTIETTLTLRKTDGARR